MSTAQEATTEFVPGADEIEFLESRQQSTPLSHETIREKLTGLTSGARLRGEAAGVQAHQEGTVLRVLYMRHADPVLGYPSFRTLLLQEWPEGEDDAYDRLLIARYFTKEQSAAPPSKLVLGVRVMRALELKETSAFFDEAEPLLLPLSANDPAEHVTFGAATVTQLRQVLRVLKAPDATDDVAQARLERTRQAIEGVLEEEPGYEKLAPKAVLDGDEVRVIVRATGRASWRLASQFYAALAARR